MADDYPRPMTMQRHAQYRVLGSGETLIEAADDADAISIARRFLHGSNLQLWQENRLIATIQSTQHEASSPAEYFSGV
jgi:hypothetical protein